MWSTSADALGTTDCTISLGAVVVVVNEAELVVVMSKMSPLRADEQLDVHKSASTAKSTCCLVVLDMSASADAVIANVN
jgi:hypothetical protein